MRIAIDGEWYDLTKWAPYHPGGQRILERFDGYNATEHFYSLHSAAAVRKLKAMAPSEAKEPVPEEDALDIAFREFRTQLRENGWWQRQYFWEFAVIGAVFSMFVAGTLLAYTHPLLSILLLSVGMQQAGWLGHDFVHGRDTPLHNWLHRIVEGWFIGFDRHWWSEKHNTHHVLTNHAEHDPDIHNQPLLFLWAPVQSIDHKLRRYQYLYFPVLYSLLYVSWRIESLKWAIREHDYAMLAFSLIPGYIWLALLPWYVSIPTLLLSGFFVAIVVTLSHESEEILPSDKRMPGFVRNQFECTRNIICPEWLTEYFYGGMQYQLEHHLFPTLPRYKYRFLKPLVQEFARAHGLEYKETGLVTILRNHMAHLRKVSQVAARACDAEADPFKLT